MACVVAAALGYRHIDSGAMYRAVGWQCLQLGVALEDEDAVARLAERSRIEVGGTGVVVGQVGAVSPVSIDGVDVTRAIRTPAIDRAAAAVARLPRVREILVARQRALGAGGGIVMEGRDIGTVVFPHADIKLYLDASEEERARRRASDPAHSGGPAAVAEVKTLLKERDRLDTTRKTSPLHAAADAVLIDTTGKGVDAVVEEVLALIRTKLRMSK